MTPSKISAPKTNNAGAWLFQQPCAFARGVVSLSGLPETEGIEIAFAGRSNVGKSSLINALTGQKGLARTSNTPGRTQELNFFLPAADRQNGNILWLVDLPGYGYARESKQKIAAWNALLTDYLRGRPQLRRIFVLIDSRHGLKKNDIEMLDMLDKAAIIYQIILTKSDKLKPPALADREQETQARISRRPAAHHQLIMSSAHKNLGLDSVRNEIAALVDMKKLGYKGKQEEPA